MLTPSLNSYIHTATPGFSHSEIQPGVLFITYYPIPFLHLHLSGHCQSIGRRGARNVVTVLFFLFPPPRYARRIERFRKLSLRGIALFLHRPFLYRILDIF